jgi:hypothetical protein
LSGNTLTYYFINNFNSPSSQWGCSAPGFIDTGTNLIDCTSSWTGRLANMWTNTFTAWNNYQIMVDNVGTPFLINQNYYSRLRLSEWNQSRYEKMFSYFTQWDDDLFTKDDNILEKIVTGLAYPTGLWISGNNLLVNEFETRKQKKVDISTRVVTDNMNLEPFSQANFSQYLSDSLSKSPIESLVFSLTSKLLHIQMKSYRYLNCDNNDDAIIKTQLFKKSL